MEPREYRVLHGGAKGVKSRGRADRVTGRGGVMDLEQQINTEVKLGNPHHHAVLGIGRAEAEPASWNELA